MSNEMDFGVWCEPPKGDEYRGGRFLNDNQAGSSAGFTQRQAEIVAAIR